MSYSTPTRPSRRFLGNKNKTEVHDLTKEDRNANGCQVDEFLRAGHGVYFIPDTLQQAHTEGYDNCAKCLGGSQR